MRILSEMSDTKVAIIGAGPYGLSLAAHLGRHGIGYRIFGRPMDSWREHMPAGMMLKSDGFASDLYDPDHEFTLERFCAEQRLQYSHVGLPIKLTTFVEYGLAFGRRMAPALEETLVTDLRRTALGFELTIESGEAVRVRHVVLAVGVTHFSFIPPVFAELPEEFVSHSFRHHRLVDFRNRRVVVVGAGASAIDLAGLLAEQGAEVTLVARASSLKFHSMPLSDRRPLWQRFRHPGSGLGPGLRTWFYSNFPGMFHSFPKSVRFELVRTTLGPSGGWFARQALAGHVTLMLGHAVEQARTENGKVALQMRGVDRLKRRVTADHIIAATGYKVDLSRLPFLGTELRQAVKTAGGSPILSPVFESSVPGLYFTGLASANSFGPVMRFAYGAGYTAKVLARTMQKACLQSAGAAMSESQAILANP
ncbi:MAG: NAD(P)-binding domain-containing protein [Terriglobia bacterium]